MKTIENSLFAEYVAEPELPEQRRWLPLRRYLVSTKHILNLILTSNLSQKVSVHWEKWNIQISEGLLDVDWIGDWFLRAKIPRDALDRWVSDGKWSFIQKPSHVVSSEFPNLCYDYILSSHVEYWIRYIQKITDSPLFPHTHCLDFYSGNGQEETCGACPLNKMINQKQCHITGWLSEMRAPINDLPITMMISSISPLSLPVWFGQKTDG